MENFTGEVVRVDGRGFGIIRMRDSIDEAKHAFFTENTSNYNKVGSRLKLGAGVEGLVKKTRQKVLPVVEFITVE